MPKDIAELDEMANKLRVLWRKAHNYHLTFAHEFLKTKKLFDAGDYGMMTETLPWTSDRWLIFKAGLVEKQIVKMMLVYGKILMQSDDREELERQKIRNAKAQREEKVRQLEERKVERETRRVERAAIAQSKAAAKETKQAQAEAEKAAKAEAEKAKQAEQAQADKRARKSASDRRYHQKKTGRQPTVADPAVLETLAVEIKAGQQQAECGRQDWIEGTLRITQALARARDQFPSDRAFNNWLGTNNITYGADMRAALIGMGRTPDVARRVLNDTKRQSYDTIWRKEMKPIVRQSQEPRFRNVSKPEFSEVLPNSPDQPATFH
jgi:hypothetical protein